MKTKIFVSYCHDDVKPDDRRLKVFVEALEAAGKGAFEILVDYLHPEAGIGADLNKFIKEIDIAEAIIILLTPGYKNRVSLKGATGVYSEFQRIYDRIVVAQEHGTYDRTFLALPLVFTDSFEKSCPE